MISKFYQLAHALADMEPTASDADPALNEWHRWRELCEKAAAFASEGNEREHEDFMDACGL